MTKTKIAILRGINVGGKRKILMQELKNLLIDIGLENVLTYIQSGNVIFTADKTNEALEEIIENAILAEFNLEVPVIVRSGEELKQCMEANPFLKENIDLTKLHLSFLKEEPSRARVQDLSSKSFKPDRFVIRSKEIFVCCEDKYHKSKLSNNFQEKKLQVQATTRNWKTITKLVELSNI